MALKSNRVELVDALRGFALLAIILLHNLTHFNLSFVPEHSPEWLRSLDTFVWDTAFFFMEGKAFAMFALLFGFSFFIQFDNAKKRGYDFRARFAWRMVILMLFALFNSLFYNGDILFLYALLGILIIPLANASNRTLLWLGLFLILQPFEWGLMIYAWLNPDFVLPNFSWAYYAPIIETMKNGSYLEVIHSNIAQGWIWNNLWQVEDGRLFKIPGLFIFGILLARLRYFIKSDASIIFWKKVLVWSAIAFFPLYALQIYIPGLIENRSVLTPFNVAMPSIVKFVFMCFLMAGFSLLWFRGGNGYKVQRFIIPYGRMSLTNYITQSIIGCLIYLSYGLGLYDDAGATVSILIGFTTFGAQLLFSMWWLDRYQQGPFESVWKKLTWINNKAKK